MQGSQLGKPTLSLQFLIGVSQGAGSHPAGAEPVPPLPVRKKQVVFLFFILIFDFDFDHYVYSELVFFGYILHRIICMTP